jgi:hypothetical protein
MYQKVSAVLVSTGIAVGIIVFMLFSVRDQLATAITMSFRKHLLLPPDLPVFLLLRSPDKVIWRNRPQPSSPRCIFTAHKHLIARHALAPIRVFILRHEYNASISQGISSLVVERVFDIVMVAVLGAISLLFVFDVPAWFYTIILIPLALGIVFYIILIFSGRLTSGNKYIRILLTTRESSRCPSPRSVVSCLFFPSLLDPDVLVAFRCPVFEASPLPWSPSLSETWSRRYLTPEEWGPTNCRSPSPPRLVDPAVAT